MQVDLSSIIQRDLRSLENAPRVIVMAIAPALSAIMAKAARNMLTRTSAQDYVKDGIHMNSVDTGWVTDEDPAAIAARKREEHGFHPPLDIVDGAARICDPIFAGLNSGAHAHGQFFKDYKPVPW